MASNGSITGLAVDRGQGHGAARLGSGQQHARAARGELGGELLDAGARVVTLREHEHGKLRAHQRHGPVLDLGGAESFGVQPAGFLELERRFLRDTQAIAAGDDEQVHRVAQGIHRRRPIALPGARQQLGELRQCRQQLAILGPVGEQLRDAAERGDIRLGCGHAGFGPGVQRHRDVHDAHERSIPANCTRRR